MIRAARTIVVLCLLGVAAASRRAPRSYDVQLAYVGYTGLAESHDCDLKVNQQGYDSLIGTLKGIEPEGPSDDEVLYQGTLRRVTKIDYCQTRPKSPSQPDELVWCVATLTGEAQMLVELRVDGQEGGGARLNARPVPGPVKALRIEGTCAAADMDEIRKDYPSGSSAGSPDGQSISESDPPKLFVGGIPRLRVGYFPPPADAGGPGWSMRVLRTVP